MSIVTHVVVGAAVGSFMPNALSGGVAGFISHILGDLIPHYDPPLGKYAKKGLQRSFTWFLLLVDFSLGLMVLWLVKDSPQMLVGGLVGGLVDLDAFFFHKLKHIGIPIHDLKSNWHKQTTAVKGLFNQGLLTLIAVAIIYQNAYNR
ncbi:hypothetical protein A3C32_00165 [Candidatus Daviesbacteria bacterium RIFCSPHIGHO2_02_FULL_41_14]|uniref:Uncharacterized protein n=1 Tax=Candidatus Daviesbacteria bacterium RIFCSPLOWO2_01_FULL_40_24 TaxID=1797787 RepID=A0A1F5MIU5_9BACT|nr:MAG: hypothetical protein A2780_02985 [Candidatus Daviesbacteria bacterium RIFCSPHIGHO2_01_FULL_41_45]OGE34094.1 MAG: hypothetical protein A3C32_00165 [Candidatus Daviesbacteria bacterium RIFCSPHIGHO2_02_FULL_41_14]OGE65249.1 MAG: hypothetical protein A3B49_02360 [Candidatus Daviesbacteria bacterium RIFCSPLOWO2_01_FULL_40_24]